MSSTHSSRPPRRDGGSNTPRILAASALGLGLVIGVIVLFSGSSEQVAKKPPAETVAKMEQVDGTLTVVEQDRLVLEPFDGGEEMTFVITDADRGNFDIAHMQSHSSVALPTRLFYERDGERLLARYKEDAPVNSQGQE
jgi:hypothetical protein